MVRNRLKLNDDKTELIVLSTRRHKDISGSINIKIGDAIINPTETVRNLGVHIDQRLSMETHVNNLRKSCYAQLRMIGRIRPCLTIETTKSLVRNLVLTRLDYCNSLLIDVPAFLVNKLQLVQNSAARLVYRQRKHDHITPALISLHWLPVAMRSRFKLCLLVYKCLRGTGPKYLNELLSLQDSKRSLRSTQDTRLLQIPRSSSKLGQRAFSISGPVVWNTLPLELRKKDSLQAFKKHLKTHFFTLAYQD